MKKKHNKEHSGNGELAIVLAILLILLLVIGFLLFRIMHSKSNPSALIQNLKPVPRAGAHAGTHARAYAGAHAGTHARAYAGAHAGTHA